MLSVSSRAGGRREVCRGARGKRPVLYSCKFCPHHLTSLKTTLDLGWDHFAAIAKNNIRRLSGPQQAVELGRRQLLSILRMKREATSLQEDSVSYHIRVVSSFLSSQKTTLVQWIDGTLDFLVEHFYTESEWCSLKIPFYHSDVRS